MDGYPGGLGNRLNVMNLEQYYTFVKGLTREEFYNLSKDEQKKIRKEQSRLDKREQQKNGNKGNITIKNLEPGLSL